MTKRVKAFCTQCRSRCGCMAIVHDGSLKGIEPDLSHPSGRALCPKGKAAPELVYHKDRLTTPLRRKSRKGQLPVEWGPISWDDALNEIAKNMSRIRHGDGAEQVAFSVTTPSGTHISDGISWIERFIRCFGSPNTIYSTEICNWHKDQTTKLTFGSDIGTPDFANTDCVLLWGHNPTATWLARNVEIMDALRRGVKLIVIDPRQTMLAKRADAWLQVKPGTDQTLALGLTRLILASNKLDERYVTHNTNAAFIVRKDTGKLLRESDISSEGAPSILLAKGEGSWIRFCEKQNEWLDDASSVQLQSIGAVLTNTGLVECETVFDHLDRIVAPFDETTVEEITGVAASQLQSTADTLVRSPSVAYYAWNGVGQGTEATQTDRAISILYGLLGHLGKAGGNVPGSAVATNDISGHDLLGEDQKCKALGVKGRPIGPPSMGWVTARDVYKAIVAKDPYPVRMLFSFGGNLLMAQPDTDRAHEALQQLGFHVHADFFINDTAQYADIVLPVATSWEREGLRVGFDSSLDGLRRVQLRPAVVSPVGESKSDIEIVLALAERLGMNGEMFGCDEDEGHNFHLKPSGITVDQLRNDKGGIEADAVLHLTDDEFRAKYGLVRLFSEELASVGQPPVPTGNVFASAAGYSTDFPVLLSCAKDVAYCHSQGRNLESLRRLKRQPELQMSAKTGTKYGLAEGDWVRVCGRVGHFVAVANIDNSLAEDCVFGLHGWQSLAFIDEETASKYNYNEAVDTTFADPVSGSINLKRVACRLEKYSRPEAMY